MWLPTGDSRRRRLGPSRSCRDCRWATFHRRRLGGTAAKCVKLHILNRTHNRRCLTPKPRTAWAARLPCARGGQCLALPAPPPAPCAAAASCTLSRSSAARRRARLAARRQDACKHRSRETMPSLIRLIEAHDVHFTSTQPLLSINKIQPTALEQFFRLCSFLC